MESFAGAKRPLDPSPPDWTEPDAVTPTSSSSKRRHQSSAFKSPPLSLKPSPTETLFRILCPADTTGGVIGKGGAIIRQFREETGAKIRIEEPVFGSEDRVIVIVADAQFKKKKDVSGGEMDGDDESSAAQRALFRVFERMLRVEEERLGEAGATGGVEEKAISCRLLAPSGQVGCVLGKGGKIIEKLRQETGAQIRVLAKELVPMCAAAGDELIHITGSFSAVRKALLSVSSCLQDNVRTEPAVFSTTKPFVTTPRGAGPPALGDPYTQRSYLPSLHAPDYHHKAYSSNAGMDVVTPGNRMVPEEEVMFRMLCSNEKISSIIGKGGVFIRALQGETGASVKVAISDSDENIIVIFARENADLEHSPAQEAVLRVHSRLAEPGVDKGSISARLLVPAQQIGCLLGKGGTIITEMRRATGASIRIFLKEQVPKCAQPNDQVVQVTGTFQSVQDALLHITGRIRETIFPLKPYASAGMTPYMSAAPEIPPPLLRSRIEPIPSGCYSSISLSHGHDPSAGFPDPTDRQTAPFHGVERIGSDRIPFSYGRESSGVYPPYDHTSPRSWAPQAISSGDPRSIHDVGINLDFRSGAMGSGIQTAVMASTTIKVVVPQHLLGFIYGENSGNLTEIREISGAKVVIYDPKACATEGKVVVSGSPDQVQIAQSLLHAFIFWGQGSS